MSKEKEDNKYYYTSGAYKDFRHPTKEEMLKVVSVSHPNLLDAYEAYYEALYGKNLKSVRGER